MAKDWMDAAPTEETIREHAAYSARYYLIFFQEFVKAGFRTEEAIELVKHAIELTHDPKAGKP